MVEAVAADRAVGAWLLQAERGGVSGRAWVGRGGLSLLTPLLPLKALVPQKVQLARVLALWARVVLSELCMQKWFVATVWWRVWPFPPLSALGVSVRERRVYETKLKERRRKGARGRK